MLYDSQAAQYDERAGVPGEAAIGVAAALDRIVGLGPGAHVLEVGAGTGAVSLPLLERPIRYTGFDSSSGMLAIFRSKLESVAATWELVVADGNARWPAEDRSIGLVFSTRAMHHIEASHAVAEITRVLAPGGWLVLGSVRRPQASVKSEMRRAMRRLLREHGIEGRNHDATAEEVFTALEARGARSRAPVVAARWTTEHRPIDSIEAWEGKEGLAGGDVGAATKAAVLAAVRQWAVARYGDIERPLVQQEYFELYPIQGAGPIQTGKR
jgi:ubiquinone/menaquinone biosynthesis C-methylase UbiE